jgi:hypothetical protein
VPKPVAKPRKNAPVNVRITVDEAFQRLRQREEPATARERLNSAIRAGRVRLWANDDVVEPSWFEGYVYVTAKVAPDGHWTAEMTMIRAVAEWPDIVWTVPARDVETLLVEWEAKTNRHPGGRPTKYNPEQILIRAFDHIYDYGLSATQDELIRKLRRKLGEAAPESSRMKEIIGPLYRHWAAKTGRK